MREEIVADLKWVAEYWPDLLEARLPGTPRPWRQMDLTPEAIAERDEQARIERFERSLLTLGASPAPVDVTILSTVLDLLVHADDLAAAVAHTTGDSPLPPPGPGELDARPYLLYAARRLPDDLVEWAAPTARQMVDRVAHALSMVYAGQRLDVTCPWCRQEAAWRVRDLPGGMIAIVCESGAVCEPPAREVGTWWGGRPVWPVQDWARLARHLQAAEERGRIAS
ncbi:hypothetical protein ACFYY8_06350 [Streptosporangium sp. NPDC001559]|uniref:hypothetical protein n=1 Tax=Streptosporangium sp. NPDC001559 TaxID=3366187 RepID=UPI0036F116CE